MDGTEPAGSRGEATNGHVLALEPAGVTLEFGPHRPETLEAADLVVLSPGVPHTLAPLEATRRRGIPVVGEMELASRFIAEPIVAVTGTNGKTTTTELIGAMLEASGMAVFVGGNIGNPLIEYVESGKPADWLVVEVSSFQLDTMDEFHPRIGCLLNISEDHLDRYPDFTAYAAAKWRLFRHQTADDTAILNGAPRLEDALEAVSLAELMKAREVVEVGAAGLADHWGNGNSMGEIITIANQKGGVGKTSLVHELQRSVSKNRGYFIEGKFDQYQRTRLERLEKSGSFNAMVSHRVRLASPTEVDAELIAWLKQAYERA